MGIKRIILNFENKKTTIYIGDGALSSLVSLIPKDISRIILISDKTLIPIRKKVLTKLKQTKLPVDEIPVRSGEKLKSISSIYSLYGELLRLKADRNSLIVALGGGSVGDAVGFVAGTFMRGILWIGIPTTLLAQVDSSIGGKTGINHEQGKNLIGLFHQPILVICETSFLKSLSKRELVSGLGEIIKYSLAYDRAFFEWLRINLSKLILLEMKFLSYAIVKSVKWKAKIVCQDEFDRKGKREVLNFGHTFGHALETVTMHKVFQHGEAVIWGMRFAILLSEIRGYLPQSESKRILDFLFKLPVPPLKRNVRREKYFEVMQKDKKAIKGKVRFVLLRKLGEPIVDANITTDDLVKSLNSLVLMEKGNGP